MILLVVFWFYVGCFCTVYHSTQFYLLKDSLIGFAISMLYPFAFMLGSILLRMLALNKNIGIIYTISKLIAWVKKRTMYGIN